jgi:cytosine deaminase
MAKGFAKIPREARYVLANATLPAALTDGFAATPDEDGLAAADITVRNGVIERIDPPGRRTRLPSLDLDRGMVWPCFVDMHTHLDKGHIWPRRRNPDGTFGGALEAVRIDREMHWRPHDVERRMDFALRSAYAHGTALIRTHLDSSHPQHRESWPSFGRMRAKWAGRIDIQAVSLFAIDHFADNAYAGEIVDLVAEHGGVLGAVTFMMPGLEALIEKMMRAAAERGLDLDFHVDETADPSARSLSAIADAALKLRFPGRIVCGHCCSLAVQPDAEARETLERVAEAGIAVVSLPMCNMYLQDRVAGRTPRWRGITLLHEFTHRGVPVAVASDNTRDPFYAYGDLDMVEVFREAVRIAHFDHPFGRWPAAVARSPAAILGRPDRGVIAAGLPADLVLFSARTFTEFLARPQADRTVLRAGTPIDRTLPDYRELDDIMVSA